MRWDSGIHYDDPAVLYDLPDPAPPTNMDNRISAALTSTALTNISTAVAAIRTNLPFLVALTEEQRRTMAKGGTKSQGMIQNSVSFAAANPTAFPGDFSTVEYAKDGALHDSLEAVSMNLAKLDEDVNDTLMVLNSELYLQSTVVYAFAKVNNRNGQYDSYINLVKPFFARPRHTPVTPPPVP